MGYGGAWVEHDFTHPSVAWRALDTSLNPCNE
jgi:hypothetical protein